MKKILVTVFLFSICFNSFAEESSYDKAARQLVEMLFTEDSWNQMIEQSVDSRLQQNPQMAEYKDLFLDFMGKYMGLKVLEPDFIELYKKSYTEAELNELIAFYSTPLGQKTISLTPELLQKSEELGMKKVQEHAGELQDAILKRAEEKQQN